MGISWIVAKLKKRFGQRSLIDRDALYGMAISDNNGGGR
jgi:hypothetical protein